MITMQTIAAIGLIYLVGINLAGFIIMGVDKKRAIRGAWRISEASLFLTALLGAALDVFWECSTSATRRSTVFQVRNAGDPGGTGTAFCPFIQVGNMLY